MIRGDVNAVTTVVAGQDQQSIDLSSWDQIEVAIRQQNGRNGNGWVGVIVESREIHQYFNDDDEKDLISVDEESFMMVSKFFFDRYSG